MYTLLNDVNEQLMFPVKEIYHVFESLCVLYFITLKRDKRIRNALITLLKVSTSAVSCVVYEVHQIIDLKLHFPFPSFNCYVQYRAW